MWKRLHKRLQNSLAFERGVKLRYVASERFMGEVLTANSPMDAQECTINV
jgi:hypothetical protein